MNIYFGGSIRGGLDKQTDYFKLIKHTKKYGTVLTEHIFNEDNSKLIAELGDTFDNYIYNRDVNWIKESDLLIADVTVPSLGVGYELGLAESLGIPVLCIADVNGIKKVSAMLTGNDNMIVKYYQNLSEAKEYITDFINKKR